MFQIVMDTNVLVAAMRSTRGASFRLLDQMGDPRWRANLTVALVLEYEYVLKRDCHDFGLTESEIDDVLDESAPWQDCIGNIFSGVRWRLTRMTIWSWRLRSRARAISSLRLTSATFQKAPDSGFSA